MQSPQQIRGDDYDVEVKWERPGLTNSLAISELYIRRKPVKIGTLVHMKCNTVWWKGKVVQIINKKSDGIQDSSREIGSDISNDENLRETQENGNTNG